MLCEQVVTAHGITWTAGYETWALWGLSVPQGRVCIAVALKGKKAYGFFKRLKDVASGHKGDQDIVVWPLISLVKIFFCKLVFCLSLVTEKILSFFFARRGLLRCES